MAFKKILAVYNPQLASELDESNPNNKGITAWNLTIYSNNKAWWVCKEGHSWLSTVHNRTVGKGCPYCAGNLPIVGKTDLATCNPKLASELDVTNPDNKGITAQDLSLCSEKKVWWVCEEGHKWPALVSSRSRGSGCPYCAGKLPIAGKTDLATLNPELASELDIGNPDNKGMTAENLTLHSSKRMTWKCKNGHRWSATVINRSKGRGCPYCAGRLPIVGETDLATCNPEIASELDITNPKNKGITARDLTVHSGQKMWWKCREGHGWIATVDMRTRGSGCPYCAGKLPIVGKTDLATLNPELAAEIDITNSKNKGISAQNLTIYSNRKIWWRCENGHMWAAAVSSRTKGSGCPKCAKQISFGK